MVTGLPSSASWQDLKVSEPLPSARKEFKDRCALLLVSCACVMLNFPSLMVFAPSTFKVFLIYCSSVLLILLELRF